jgi:hypothetical protein
VISRASSPVWPYSWFATSDGAVHHGPGISGPRVLRPASAQRSSGFNCVVPSSASATSAATAEFLDCGSASTQPFCDEVVGTVHCDRGQNAVRRGVIPPSTAPSSRIMSVDPMNGAGNTQGNESRSRIISAKVEHHWQHPNHGTQDHECGLAHSNVEMPHLPREQQRIVCSPSGQYAASNQPEASDGGQSAPRCAAMQSCVRSLPEADGGSIRVEHGHNEPALDHGSEHPRHPRCGHP